MKEKKCERGVVMKRRMENGIRTAGRVLFFVWILVMLTGCSGDGTAKLANEISFSLDEISEIAISYDEEEMTFLESESDQLVVKEYMTKNKSKYYAKVKESSGSIHISEGGKPFLKSGFSRYIEVYLPSSYQKGLTVTSTDGKVDLSELSLNLSDLRIDCTSGTMALHEVTAENIYLSSTSGNLKLGTIKADQIRLETTSGTLSCEELEGEVLYASTSGNCEIGSAIGSGEYKAENSGRLDVNYTEVDGDLSLFNKNDDIRLTLPKALEFEFRAVTKNGSVKTSFQEEMTLEENTMKGRIGKNPEVTIEVETKNGKIEVVQ